MEQRIEVLERNVDRLEHDLNARINAVSDESRLALEGLRQERDERRKGDDRTSERIREAALGDWHLQFVGLAWLILGVIGTSIPDGVVFLSIVHCNISGEIASLASRIRG